jgi:PAS domain S-box-containing protein
MSRLKTMKDSQTLLPPDDEARYRLLTEGTNDIIYSVDRDGKLLYISPQIEQYGFVAENLISTNFLEHVAVEDRDWVADDFLQIVGAGGERLTVFRVRTPNGETVWLEDYGKVQRRSAGEAVGMIGVLRDVTSRKQAELQLEKERDELQRLKAIITRGPAIIFLWRLAENFPVEYVTDRRGSQGQM